MNKNSIEDNITNLIIVTAMLLWVFVFAGFALFAWIIGWSFGVAFWGSIAAVIVVYLGLLIERWVR